MGSPQRGAGNSVPGEPDGSVPGEPGGPGPMALAELTALSRDRAAQPPGDSAGWARLGTPPAAPPGASKRRSGTACPAAKGCDRGSAGPAPAPAPPARSPPGPPRAPPAAAALGGRQPPHRAASPAGTGRDAACALPVLRRDRDRAAPAAPGTEPCPAAPGTELSPPQEPPGSAAAAGAPGHACARSRKRRGKSA